MDVREAPRDAAPVGPGLSRRQENAALVALTLPVLLISMDATILGFAVPHLSESLQPSSSELLWIIDVYSFVLAGLLITMGNIGDRIGRRRLLMIGAAGFSVASVAAAFAPSTLVLIAARAALGVAGATLMPSTLSLIRNIFVDGRRRLFAIAVWATMFAVAPSPIASTVRVPDVPHVNAARTIRPYAKFFDMCKRSLSLCRAPIRPVILVPIR